MRKDTGPVYAPLGVAYPVRGSQGLGGEGGECVAEMREEGRVRGVERGEEEGMLCLVWHAMDIGVLCVSVGSRGGCVACHE